MNMIHNNWLRAFDLQITRHPLIRCQFLGMSLLLTQLFRGAIFFAIILSSATSNAQQVQTDTSEKLVRFITLDSGIYRVSYEDLLARGIDLLGLKHQQFGLFSDGNPVAIRTVGKKEKRSRHFGPRGYIEFYAEKADDLYHEGKVFTLVYNSGQLQINNIKRREHKLSGDQLRSAAAKELSIFEQKIIIEENNYYDYLSPSQTDPWHFGQIIARDAVVAEGTSLQFEIQQLEGNFAEMEVQMYGLIDTNKTGDDHQITVYINGLEVVNTQFDGQHKESISVANVPIYQGENDFTFNLRATNGTNVSSVGLNKLVLNYPKRAVARDGYLEGRFESDYLVVDGFAMGERVNAYRRDSSGAFLYLRKLSRKGALALARTDGIEADYIFVTERGTKKPKILPIPIGPDIAGGDAEYLIISHSSFIGAELDRLVNLRELLYSVKVVRVEDIYTQYGDQLPSAKAIHDYIRFAANYMGTRFVAIIGADTYDYKQYGQYESPVKSYVPTLYRGAQGGALYSYHVQSDAAYGDLNDDDIPDIPVGRFPVRSQQELGVMVSKLEKFENSMPFTFSTLIADSGFSSDANDWIDSLPEGSRIKGQMRNVNWEIFRAYVDEDGAGKAYADILRAFNLGVVVVNYFGHGSMSALGSTSPSLLNSNDVAFLNNTESPFMMLQWTSWTGAIANPDANNSIMYSFLTEDDRGAASMCGLSTITSRVNANRMSRELNQRLYQTGATLGEAIVGAKAAIANNYQDDSKDIQLGLQIIGDPALIVNWWSN